MRHPTFQEPVRNSGHMGGRFSEKRRIKNPATGEYFKLTEAWIEWCERCVTCKPKEFIFEEGAPPWCYSFSGFWSFLRVSPSVVEVLFREITPKTLL